MSQEPGEQAEQHIVCSGSVVVTAYDSESGRPGSNPEWVLIYYEAPITAPGLPEPSSLRQGLKQLDRTVNIDRNECQIDRNNS